jgi:hypothetical protein
MRNTGVLFFYYKRLVIVFWFHSFYPFLCALFQGEVSEWPIEHAWKACLPQGNEGSNPSLSAFYYQSFNVGGVLFFRPTLHFASNQVLAYKG